MTTIRDSLADPMALAAEYLSRSGLRVLDSKWRHDGAELAVVAADGRVLVACDVRTSRAGRFHPPLDAPSPARLRRLRRLAVAWMAAHDVRFEQVRLDTVGLIWEGPGGYTLEHVRGVGQR